MYSNPRAVILENAPNVLAEIYQSICNSHNILDGTGSRGIEIQYLLIFQCNTKGF